MKYAKKKMLLEPAESNKYLPTSDLCRIELNSIIMPIFTFGSYKTKDKNGNIIEIKVGSTTGIVRKNVLVDGKKIDYTISFDSEHGRPGDQDYLIFRKIEEIAVGYITRGEKIPEFMYVGTINSLGKYLSKSIIERFIARISGARIRGKYAYFQADGGTDEMTGKATGKYITAIEGISLYNGGRVVSQKDKQNANDNDTVGVYIELSDYYKNNLKHYYTKSIYLQYLQQLEKGISRRIFELLILKDSTEDAYINYSYLCDLLQITRYPNKSAMTKDVERIMHELESKKLVIWKNHSNPTRINNENDWQLKFSLRPLMTPAQRLRQLDWENKPRPTKIIKKLHRNEVILQKTNKIVVKSPIEDMVSCALKEEANKIDKIRLKKLKAPEIKAIIKAKDNKRSHIKIECYDKHLIPEDAVLLPQSVPLSPADNEAIDNPF